MALFGRFRRQNKQQRAAQNAAEQHLASFAASRLGVEAWVEEPTSLNPPSLLLVALDGEWTRRPVPSTGWAEDFAARHSLACHQAGVFPYPQRMRDFDARQRITKRRQGRDA